MAKLKLAPGSEDHQSAEELRLVVAELFSDPTSGSGAPSGGTGASAATS